MTRDEMLKEGYTCYCIQCHAAYKTQPTVQYEDGHGGRRLGECGRCGCDLFASMKDDSQVK
jgi:hypothetical protein